MLNSTAFLFHDRASNLLSFFCCLLIFHILLILAVCRMRATKNPAHYLVSTKSIQSVDRRSWVCFPSGTQIFYYVLNHSRQTLDSGFMRRITFKSSVAHSEQSSYLKFTKFPVQVFSEQRQVKKVKRSLFRLCNSVS